MDKGEEAAHALVAQLKAAGVEARVTGGGDIGEVVVEPVASRSVVARCSWYLGAPSGLRLGMNVANARYRSGRERRPLPEGPEYLVVLYDSHVHVAEGRAWVAADVVARVRAWLAHQLVLEAPFINESPRMIRALAERLDPQLRRELLEGQLWVYGDGRSCRVVGGENLVATSFLFGQARVAYTEALDDVPEAVAAWLIARVSVRELAMRVPAVEIEPHAEVLETDPARWHWLHVRDRIADPDDVLAPLSPLIEVLAASSIATTFYSFSSLDRLCFSASSHYPWVTDGLPVVAPTDGGVYMVGDLHCDLSRATELIDETLAAALVRPFVGSAPHHEMPLLSECMARQGSRLRPQLEQRGEWYRLVVAEGSRQCEVSERHVTFTEATRELRQDWPSLDAAARAIRRYLEDGESLDELAADASIRVP